MIPRPRPTVPGSSGAPGSLSLLRTRTANLRYWTEHGIQALLFGAAGTATVATAAIFLTLFLNGLDFFRQVSVTEFLLGTEWAPDFVPQRFGALPLVKGTFQVAIGAIVIGLPLGVGSAIYLSEFATPRVRRILKPTIELLAGIPSIIFGLVALFIIGPIIADWLDTGLFTALSATIALGIMVVPIIASISEDALRAVPLELREGALALGATRWEATSRIIVPAARSGITAAVILGFSRAIGETMVVTMAAGNFPTLTWDYREPAQTVTAYIANRAAGDLPQGSIPYISIFAIGIVLFIITFVINLIAVFALARQRRRFG